MLGWSNTSRIKNQGWTCGYCGKEVGGNVGYCREHGMNDKVIYICPYCENPTAFIHDEQEGYSQYPGADYGKEIENLPKTVDILYSEIRRCVQYTSYTAAVLAMRKLLMHVAVDQGAPTDLKFIEYITYLDDNGYIPTTGKEWVDEIRKAGNEATHEIFLVDEDTAKQLLDFTEMLLKIIYEFPAKIQRR